MFDFIFKKIEENMRELGWGDVTVNKKMKDLVKIFYSILLNCEKYRENTRLVKNVFLYKYLDVLKDKKQANHCDLVEYFDKYLSFFIAFFISSLSLLTLSFRPSFEVKISV